MFKAMSGIGIVHVSTVPVSRSRMQMC